jgi:hypothetical protein
VRSIDRGVDRGRPERSLPDVVRHPQNEAATILRVVVGEHGKLGIIAETGGFFGLAARRIALPVSNLDIRDDRLVVRNLTAQEVGRVETREEELAKFIPTTDDRKVQIGLAL